MKRQAYAQNMSCCKVYPCVVGLPAAGHIFIRTFGVRPAQSYEVELEAHYPYLLFFKKLNSDNEKRSVEHAPGHSMEGFYRFSAS
jgi:hypothetical protein